VSAPFANVGRPIRLRTRRSERAQLKVVPKQDTAPVSVDTRLFVWQRDGAGAVTAAPAATCTSIT